MTINSKFSLNDKTKTQFFLFFKNSPNKDKTERVKGFESSLQILNYYKFNFANVEWVMTISAIYVNIFGN